MNIYLVQAHNFNADVLSNLLILLNKHSGIAKFLKFPSILNLGLEELSTRCIPCQKLEQKFLLERSLLQEVLKVLPFLGAKDQYLQSNTFSDNSMYARMMEGVRSYSLPELKKYNLEQLINGTLRVSFLKQSFPFQSIGHKGEHVCEPNGQHDVYTISQMLFEKCKLLRREQELEADAFLVLLTNGNLDSNWIYTLDPAYGNNIILNTCPLHQLNHEQLPEALAFYLVKALLAKKSFRSFLDWYLHLHPQSQNCLMDFNLHHQQALQGMQTVGICKDCQPLIQKETVTPELYQQLLAVLGDL